MIRVGGGRAEWVAAASASSTTDSFGRTTVTLTAAGTPTAEQVVPVEFTGLLTGEFDAGETLEVTRLP